jgi:hypothetical protein
MPEETPHVLGLTEAAVLGRLVATQEARAAEKVVRPLKAATTILPDYLETVVSRTPRTLKTSTSPVAQWVVNKTPARMARPSAAKAVAAGMSATMMSMTILALAKVRVRAQVPVALQRAPWAPKYWVSSGSFSCQVFLSHFAHRRHGEARWQSCRQT